MGKKSQNTAASIVGKKIVEVVVDVENYNEVTIVLDDGTAIGVMCDPEGNSPGTLHIFSPKGKLSTLGGV